MSYTFVIVIVTIVMSYTKVTNYYLYHIENYKNFKYNTLFYKIKAYQFKRIHLN